MSFLVSWREDWKLLTGSTNWHVPLMILIHEDSQTAVCSSALIIVSFLTVCYLNQHFSTFFSCKPLSHTEAVPVPLDTVVVFQLVLKSFDNIVKYYSILLLATAPSQLNFGLVRLVVPLAKYLLISCLPLPVPPARYCSQLLKVVSWQGTTLIFPQ